MNTESDYSAMARTNPVFVTAKTAVCLMAQAEIPDAERIVRSLKIENLEPLQDLSGSSVILGNALVVEAKYRTMCSLIMNSGYRTCVSLFGRLDSITVPDLLLKWEKEKTATNIERAIVDCERLTYISSAGVRVLLTMQEKTKCGVTMIHVSPSVKKLLEQNENLSFC